MRAGCRTHAGRLRLGRSLSRVLEWPPRGTRTLRRTEAVKKEVDMTHSLRVSRVIQADADTLFQAWTDPDELMHWWRMEGDGWKFAGATIDLRVGGHYRLGMTAPDGNAHTAVGTYRDILRPRRLQFTWDWENPANRVGETVVTVEFNAVGAGRTEVVITHQGFAESVRKDRHEHGWTQLMNLLERFAGSRSTIGGHTHASQ